jgi:uncharacterized protein YndB with AHSA1/START domain
MMNQTINFQKFPEKGMMVISHRYNAPIDTLWNAYLQTEILEKWWAPEPYKAIVISNDFRVGGRLHYYMLSPEGERHYCIAEYLSVEDKKSYEVLDAFCDEKAVINPALPRMKWFNDFNHRDGVTTVTNTIVYEKPEDMEKLLEMGFEEGYRMGLNQLFTLLNPA